MFIKALPLPVLHENAQNRKIILKPPNNFIAGRPKAALLFWFFSDFRCDVPLFIVVLDVCGCEKLVKIDVNCWTGRWPPVWEVAVHLAVAGDVLDEISDLIESVSEGFPGYSCITPL